MEARRNELLTMAPTVAAEQARALGLPPDQTEQIGAAVADALAELWGGQTLYFAHDASYRLSRRDGEVVQAPRMAPASPPLLGPTGCPSKVFEGCCNVPRYAIPTSIKPICSSPQD